MEQFASQRTRVRSEFRTELPWLVQIAELDSGKLCELTRLLEPSHISTTLVQERLVEIATRHRHSRKLERDRVGRSAANKCLSELQDQVRTISKQLESRPELEIELGCLVPINCDPGLEPLQISAHLFDELARAAEFVAAGGECRSAESDLRAIQKSACRVSEMLTSLPVHAEWALVLIQQYTWAWYPRVDSKGGLTFLRELAQWLASSSSAAYEASRFDRGPLSDTVLTRTVQDLKLLYESATGGTVSHFSREGRHYVGAAQSPFGKFVGAAINLIDGDFRTERGVTDAISFAAWPSRAMRRRAEVERQTQLRQLRTLEILRGLGVTNFSPQL